MALNLILEAFMIVAGCDAGSLASHCDWALRHNPALGSAQFDLCADSHACYASKAVAEIVPDHIAEKIQEGVAQLNPTFYRNGEPLQDQIHISVQEAMATDAINQEDMDYWFSEGPGDIDVSVPLKVCPVKGHVEFTARSGHVRAVRVSIHLNCTFESPRFVGCSTVFC